MIRDDRSFIGKQLFKTLNVNEKYKNIWNVSNIHVIFIKKNESQIGLHLFSISQYCLFSIVHFLFIFLTFDFENTPFSRQLCQNTLRTYSASLWYIV